MTKLPKVSVVVPTYNRAALLREALESVRRQTVTEGVEIIVVDDRRTTEDIAGVVREYGPGIVYLKEPRPGVSAARNTGIRQATAPLIAFLDSDDRWLPHKLERQLAYLDAHPEVGLCYARLCSYPIGRPEARRLDPPTAATTFEQLLNGPNTVTTSTVVVRHECFEAVGMFNPALRASEDHELWLRIARRFSIGFMDEPLAEYRRETQGINADMTSLYEGYRGFYTILLEEYRNRLRDPRAMERQLAKFEYLCGTTALKRGQPKIAVQLVGSALKRDAWVGRQFVKNGDWRQRLWLPLKPYAALTVSLVNTARGK